MIPALILALAVCGACSSSSSGANSTTSTTEAASGAPSGSASAAEHGGGITVLVHDGWSAGLDPATNTTGGVNLAEQQAIFGGLFLLEADDDGSNAHIVSNQAESYSFSDGGKTLTIKIRPGITFTDGTDFDAEAVAWNFRRDVKSSCTCAPSWPLTEKNGIVVTGPLTVQLHFTRPNPVAIHGFPVSNANWIASPTALKKMGEEAFKIKPVGAGPFTVVSNRLSDELALKRNPDFFKEDLPYLDKLTIKRIATDQAGYQALLAGAADAYLGMATPPIIQQAKRSGKFTVTGIPPVSPYVIQLNTSRPPFDNMKAREVLYYATNWEAINQGVFDSQYPISQMFTAPGGLFYHKKVPGYRTYNLDKAKQLVTELGGLKVNLIVFKTIYTAKQIAKALQTQWKKAGVRVTLEELPLDKIIQAFNGGHWQAALQSAGEWDPAVGIGVGIRFKSKAPFSGVHDPELDNLLNKAAGTLQKSARDRLYQKAAKRISDHAYAPFGIVFAPSNVVANGVHGPGLTTKIPPLAIRSEVIFGQVWTENGE